MDDLKQQLAEAMEENARLKRLLELRRENFELRVTLDVPTPEAQFFKVILAVLAEAYNVRLDLMLSRTRTDRLVEARAIAYWLLRKRSALTLERIGEYFNRDHGTVLNGLRLIESRVDTDKAFRFRFNGLLDRVEKECKQLNQESKESKQPAPGIR